MSILALAIRFENDVQQQNQKKPALTITKWIFGVSSQPVISSKFSV
jgi:hypothetical protein